MPDEKVLRIDKWLKIARIFKKRPEAAEAVESGSVKVNDERVKPSKMVKAGDRLTIKIDSKYRDYVIKEITSRSVKTSIAREFYEIEKPDGITPEMEETIKLIEDMERDNRKNQKGKPNKKERREIHKFKYGK